MFWRILRRLLQTNRARLFVVLLALGAGAAVTSALLNLQVDAERRLTREFRAFGANVLITPRNLDSAFSSGATLEESIMQHVPLTSPVPGGIRIGAFAYLYLIADASSAASQGEHRVVVAGLHALGADDLAEAARTNLQSPDKQLCILGSKVAAEMHLRVGDRVALGGRGTEESCQIALITLRGDAQDNQILPHLDVAQRLAGLPGRVSLIQLEVPGTPQQIERYIADLQKRIPEADVHGIRQFTEAEARLYEKIRGLLIATVALILVLTGLCVMAAMTNIALERQRDVGLMKALGGAASRVVRLFLAEAALLGLIGGLLGSAVGLFVSMWLGRAVFGVAAQPRLVVYPVAVALTVLVAIAGAFPLRRLAAVRPGEILRGVS